MIEFYTGRNENESLSEAISSVIKLKKEYKAKNMDVILFNETIRTESPYLHIEHEIATRKQAMRAIKELTNNPQDMKTVFLWFKKTYDVNSHPVIDKVQFICDIMETHYDKLHPIDSRQ